MNCRLFAEMDQVFGLKNKTLKNTGKMKKILEKSGKSQGILSVRKSGNPADQNVGPMLDNGFICFIFQIVMFSSYLFLLPANEVAGR